MTNGPIYNRLTAGSWCVCVRACICVLVSRVCVLSFLFAFSQGLSLLLMFLSADVLVKLRYAQQKAWNDAHPEFFEEPVDEVVVE